MYVSSVGTKSAKSFSVNPIVVHIKWAGAEQPPATSFSVDVLNEATIDSMLLAATEQFEDQVTNRLLIAALEEYEDYRRRMLRRHQPKCYLQLNIVCVLYAFLF